MNISEAKAEVFLLALQGLSKAEREAVLARLLADPWLREDLLDIVLIEQRRDEPSRPFRDYLAEREKKSRQ